MENTYNRDVLKSYLSKGQFARIEFFLHSHRLVLVLCFLLFNCDSRLFPSRFHKLLHTHSVAVCCSVLRCVVMCCSVLQGQTYFAFQSQFAPLFDVFLHVLAHTQCYTHTVAVCRSVLQCVAVCCIVLQYLAVFFKVHGSVLQSQTHIAFQSRFAPFVAVSPQDTAHTHCCSVLQCVALCCIVLHCVAVCCSVLQCVVMCCSVLQSQIHFAFQSQFVLLFGAFPHVPAHTQCCTHIIIVPHTLL